MLTTNAFPLPRTYLKFRGVKIAHKVVVKLEHLNVTIHASVLVDGMDVVFSVKSVRGETPNVF